MLDASSYALMSDNSVEGNYIKRPVQMPFEGGNEITLELLSCDKSYYDYFQQLASQQSQGLSSTSPFNPLGNFDNGALGYFGSFYSTSLDINL